MLFLLGLLTPAELDMDSYRTNPCVRDVVVHSFCEFFFISAIQVPLVSGLALISKPISCRTQILSM